MQFLELHHKHTNGYLIQAGGKWILFDAGWPDSYSVFAKTLSRNAVRFEDIAYLFVSHFHMDHCGTAELLKDHGITLLLHEVQAKGPEEANRFFERKPHKFYRPITPKNTQVITSAQSRTYLAALGLDGEIIPTPGHSDDSISLVIDNENAFTGDLPHHDLAESYADPVIAASWKRLLDRGARYLYPAHGVRYSVLS